MKKSFTSDVFVPSVNGIERSKIAKGKTAPLYMSRKVVNSQDIIDWAKDQGFTSVIDPSELHVTVIYSRRPVDWFDIGENWSSDANGNLTIEAGGPRVVQVLGDKGAVVLLFASETLKWRNQSAQASGASWDYAEYQPHITITYQKGDLDLSSVEPYRGKIVLGPEIFEDLDADWSPDSITKIDISRIAKADETLGVVFGWAIVSEINGEPYYDLNIDENGERVPEHITEAAMLKASLDFAKSARAANEQHRGPDIGTYPYIMPLTKEIAEAFGIECDKTGLMVGFEPTDKAMVKRFKSGELTGFSIEGSRISFMEHSDA